MALLTAMAEAVVSFTTRGIKRRRKARALARATPQTAAEISEHAPASASDVLGHAIPGSSGPLAAPLSGAGCVWSRIVVQERFQAWRPGPVGPLKSARHVAVAEWVSGPLMLRDKTGEITVDPGGASFELAEPGFAEFESRADEDGELLARISAVLGSAPKPRHREMTLGYLVEEWIVQEGDEVEVIGHAQSDPSGVRIGKAPRRPLIIRQR